MKCINCGAEIKPEYKVCPYCGTSSQIVPDYSVYDEDDIKIIVESAKDTTKSSAYIKEQREAKALAKRKAEEAAKQRKMKITISMVLIACMLLVMIGVIMKVSIDNKNDNSFEYQMKQADSAMFKGEMDKAESYYLKALILEADSIDARLELADLYLKKNDMKQAERYLKEIITRDRENYDAYRMLFDMYSDAGNIDAILRLKEGVTDLKIQSIFIQYNVDEPLLSVPTGTYTEDFKVSISAKKGVEVYYTLNGLDPKTEGTKYKNSVEIEGAGMHTIKVVAKNEIGIFSDVVTETYVIEYEAPEDPVVNPNGGVFDKETYVNLFVPSGCSAYFTWDRSEPTKNSEKYISPILIPEGKNMLSIIIIDDETGLKSGVYRGMYEYTVEEEE